MDIYSPFIMLLYLISMQLLLNVCYSYSWSLITAAYWCSQQTGWSQL